MKIIHLLLAAAIIAGCGKPSENQGPAAEDPSAAPEVSLDPSDEPSTEPSTEPSDDSSVEPGPARPEPEPVVVEEPYLVTSQIIMDFIQNVTYDERDYSYTHVTDEPYAPYGAPGDADLPPTVPVSWNALPEEGALTLRLDDGEWAYDTALPAGTTSYELSNLVPGRTYQWTVTRDDVGAVVGRGSFKTIGQVHQVFFATKVRNARDLGGWTTTDGKKVKYRRLYRGGDIGSSYLSKKGINQMLAEGIRAEIDLRESKDLNGAKSSRLGTDIAFYNANMSKAYGGLIREYPDKVTKTFKKAVEFLREGYPTYFHCSIGRDRTGTMAVIFLGVLGVSESDISKEYELLFFSPADWSLNGGKTEFDYSRTKKYGLPYACDTLWQLGGQALGVADTDLSVSFAQRVEAYLTSNEVDQKDIDDFRTLMLE